MHRKSAIALSIFLLTIFIPLNNHVSTSADSIELRDHSIADYVPENTWYHDCSNLTDFDGVGNDTWFAEFGYNVSGTMNSNDSYFYADDYGAGSFGHGPLRYHTLSTPIRVSQFISLDAELELEVDLPEWDTTPEFGHIMVI